MMTWRVLDISTARRLRTIAGAARTRMRSKPSSHRPAQYVRPYFSFKGLAGAAPHLFGRIRHPGSVRKPHDARPSKDRLKWMKRTGCPARFIHSSNPAFSRKKT
jgi:hypothetical protein